MEFVWSCMVISFKGGLGLMFWGVAVIIFSLCMAGLVALISLIGEFFNPPKTKRRTEYDGQPIIVQGGKDGEGDNG